MAGKWSQEAKERAAAKRAAKRESYEEQQVEETEVATEIVEPTQDVIDVPQNSEVLQVVDTLGKDLEIARLKDEIEQLKLQTLPQWEGRDICVLFPCMKTTNPMTAACLIALALDFTKERIRFDFEFGDSMIYHARDKLAHRFMTMTQSQWALFIDDDMIPPIGRPDFTITYGNIPNTYPRERLEPHFLQRLLSANKTLIGATYFGRRTNGGPMFKEGLYEVAANRAARTAVNQVRETEWVGTGCMLIHRSVFEAIQRTFPEQAPTEKYPYWSYFMPLKEDGEDVAFCKRAKESGHPAHVDLGLHCFHVGYSAYAAHNTQDTMNAFHL